MERISPEVLLKIVDCTPDASEYLDAILCGRAESMRGYLMDELSGCEDPILLKSLLGILNALPKAFRTRILVSSELGEWMSNRQNELAGLAGASGGSYTDLLSLFQRETLVCTLLTTGPLGIERMAHLPEQIWSPMGDWQAERHDGHWTLIRAPTFGDVIAVDFDSPLASKHEAASGILSHPRLAWSDTDRTAVVEKLQHALLKIDEVAPEYGVLIRNVTRRVIVRKSVERFTDYAGTGSPFGSEHVPRQPGAIRLLNMQLREFTTANCMESLLHESTHNLLAAWETMNGRFVSRNQDYRPISPWSGNPIPNSSFIHAIFVYYACHKLFLSYRDTNSPDSKEDMAHVAQRLPIFGVGFLTNQRLVDMLTLEKPLNIGLENVLCEIQSRMREFYRSSACRKGIPELEHAA
jgi:hypothetical protein